MDPQLPKPDCSWGLEWDWPWRKFNLDPEDLFTTLHDRFNTRKLPVQDPGSFHRNVIECVTISDTLDDFYFNLEQRKAQRIEEIDSAWESVKSTIFLHSEFFDGYTKDQREEDERRHQRRTEKLERLLNKKRMKRRLNSATASLTTEQADLAPTQVPPLEPVQPPPHNELSVQNPPPDMTTSETSSDSLKHIDQPQPTLSLSHPDSQATESSLSKKRKMASSEDNTEDETNPSLLLPQESLESDAGENGTTPLSSIQMGHSAPKKAKGKPQVSHLQIGKRDDTTLRKEQSISPKQPHPKNISQGRPLGEKSSPLAEEFLHSKRSRQNPGQELFYLDDDATACSAEDTIQDK
ncbi:hypothetical protein GGI43DRAFT_428943 [Trichoderma evansii]